MLVYLQQTSLRAQTAWCGVVVLRYNKVPQLHTTLSEPFIDLIYSIIKSMEPLD